MPKAVARGCNPLRPCDALCGVQNTVTNGLHLVLAAQAKDRQAFDREYEFLNRWFKEGKAVPLLKGVEGSGIVVRERVSEYLSGESVYGFQENLIWAGDQGLILGGIVDRMNFVGRDSGEYAGLFTLAKAILLGVQTFLTNADRILQPWTPGEPSPGWDDGDYRTGPAVFMRYLLYIHQSNADIRTFLDGSYSNFVGVNAKYVLENPSRDIVGLVNDLAILVAAAAMLASIDEPVQQKSSATK